MAVAAGLFAVHYASSVFAPLALALFIVALVWPLQSSLQARMPKLLALLLVMLAIVVVFVSFASLLAWGFGRVGRSIVNDAARLQTIYEQGRVWLEEHGIFAGVWAEHFDVRWLVRTGQQVTERLTNTLTFWLVVLVYVMLALLEVDSFKEKLQLLRNRDAGRIILQTSVLSAVRLRKYMLVRTAMSVVTGLLVWAFATIAGLRFAGEWGVIAFALNYIPFIGPFFATVFPTLFALAQFGSWEATLVIFLGLNAIQFIVGSYIEPRISGSVLALSPIVVLFSVLLWTFVWGIFGAFIGVPITIVVLAFCAHHPTTRWLADLLGASREPAAS